MPTLSKYQQLRASSKTTKKSSTLICLEITKLRAKYRNSTQPPAKKFPSKRTVSADSRVIWYPKIWRNGAPNENLSTQKSGEIPTLHTEYLLAKNPASQRNQSSDLQCESIDWFPYEMSSYRKVFSNRLSSALCSLNKLSQITETSTNDMQTVLHISYLIDVIFAKFPWSVFWMPKFNFRLKFINTTTFFVAPWNAAPTT